MEIALEFTLFIIAGMLIFIGLAILGIVVTVRCNSESTQPPKSNPRERPNFLIMDDLDADSPKCICKDVNQCTTWCISKKRFYENPPID